VSSCLIASSRLEHALNLIHFHDSSGSFLFNCDCVCHCACACLQRQSTMNTSPASSATAQRLSNGISRQRSSNTITPTSRPSSVSRPAEDETRTTVKVGAYICPASLGSSTTDCTLNYLSRARPPFSSIHRSCLSTHPASISRLNMSSGQYELHNGAKCAGQEAVPLRPCLFRSRRPTSCVGVRER